MASDMRNAPSGSVRGRDHLAGKIDRESNANADAVQVAIVPKSKRTQLRVSIKSFAKGRQIEIATFARNGAGDFVPTNRAIVVPPTLIRSLILALEKGEGMYGKD
jgi:hypothetical protein